MEMQSRILYKLDEILCRLVNMTRKKGTAAVTPGEQFQPDYVKKAKKEFEKSLAKANRMKAREIEEMFAERNKHLKSLETEEK